jgi:hypothetical protein
MSIGKTDIEMMQQYLSWPQLVLPVKRYKQGDSWPQCGVMIPKESTVFLINMWNIEPGSLKTCSKEEYKTYEEVIQAGWVVD